MADAIVPDQRAPEPGHTDPESRDYSAEYARREAIARAQGYRSYWHKRQVRTAARRRANQSAAA